MLRVAVARVPDAPPPGDAVAPGWFGDDERRRWEGLRPPARRAFAASRALLRELLQAATGVPASDWDVSARAGVAPVARAPAHATGAIHVSLSHRLDWVAAAVSDVPVGVDVECERAPRGAPAERAALMLSPAELASWQRLAPSAQEAALLARWTVKEAWFKASPPETAPGDFRRIAARAGRLGDAGANVRTWASPPIHLALCSPDAQALATVDCELPAAASSLSWHVRRIDFAT